MAARAASLDKMNIEYDINPNITQSIQMHVFQKNWGSFLPGGIALIILGITAISLSAVTTLDIEYLLGSILVASGIVQYIGALRSRGWGEFFPALSIAILYASVGIILLKYQVGAVHSLTLFLTVYLMVEGILKIAHAFLFEMAGWGWVLFSGILAFLAGALIFSQWPTSPAWVVSLVVGLDLLSSGWSIVMIEVAARIAPRQEGKVPSHRRTFAELTQVQGRSTDRPPFLAWSTPTVRAGSTEWANTAQQLAL